MSGYNELVRKESLEYESIGEEDTNNTLSESGDRGFCKGFEVIKPYVVKVSSTINAWWEKGCETEVTSKGGNSNPFCRYNGTEETSLEDNKLINASDHPNI